MPLLSQGEEQAVVLPAGLQDMQAILVDPTAIHLQRDQQAGITKVAIIADPERLVGITAPCRSLVLEATVAATPTAVLLLLALLRTTRGVQDLKILPKEAVQEALHLAVATTIQVGLGPPIALAGPLIALVAATADRPVVPVATTPVLVAGVAIPVQAGAQVDLQEEAEAHQAGEGTKNS